MKAPRRLSAIALVALLAFAGGLSCRAGSASAVAAAPDTLPSHVSDEAFWHLITDFSEPDGYFRSDNFLSNELAFQRVLPTLTSTLPKGGVYVGVGPEQNFTYLVALQPKLAFIVDIRRGNLIEQLLYKAFVEMSADRADFLSRLFARPRPAGLASNATVEATFAAFATVAPSQSLFDENLEAAKARLVSTHHFALSSSDLDSLAYVYSAFYQAGPDLNYTFLNGAGGGAGRNGNFPTYADLMTETDGRGEQRSYLATEEQFRALKTLERNNAIIPLVGNFAGPQTLRAVGRYLQEHNATVTAFYTSNVEMYLFQQADDWQKFYGNVATMPLARASTFIRSVSNRGARGPGTVFGARAATRLCSMVDLIGAYRAGKIRGYNDIVAMSR